MTDARAIVRRLGGVARSRTLRDAGVSTYAQRRLVEAGGLVRVGRSWLALPTADAALMRAAASGVVITCTTQAARLGLWVLAPSTRMHVGADRRARIRIQDEHVHWMRPPIPRHPDVLVDPVENVLVLMSRCAPFEDALVVWEAALRKDLVQLDALRRLSLPPAARRLCDSVDPWSDSGLESLAISRLRWLGLPLRKQIWIRGHRVDVLIGERLVLQIDGGTHVGAQREEDIRHDAELALLGYHVIRVGYGQVIHRWHEVQDLLMRAVAQGLHRAR